MDSRGSTSGSEPRPRKGFEEFRHAGTPGREETKEPGCETEPDNNLQVLVSALKNGFSWHAH